VLEGRYHLEDIVCKARFVCVYRLSIPAQDRRPSGQGFRAEG
jgi:hypothetical protein